MTFKDCSEAYMCVPNLRFPPVHSHVSVLLDTCKYENHENHCFSYAIVSNALLVLAIHGQCTGADHFSSFCGIVLF